MKFSIIIPVYNEKNTILQLINKIDELVIDGVTKEVVIIDDCSNDGTKELLSKIKNHTVIFHEVNKGKGSAIRTGLSVITGEYIVIQDADLEYDPADLVPMLKKMVAENLNVLYGSRRLSKTNTQYSGILYYIGGWILTILANILYGQNLTDEPTCYKMFKTDFLKQLPLQCTRFEFCPEVTALSAIAGNHIQEVPISYHPRHKKEGKKIKLKDEFAAIWVLLKYSLHYWRRSVRNK